jgi:hypothetical protein
MTDPDGINAKWAEVKHHFGETLLLSSGERMDFLLNATAETAVVRGVAHANCQRDQSDAHIDDRLRVTSWRLGTFTS